MNFREIIDAPESVDGALVHQDAEEGNDRDTGGHLDYEGGGSLEFLPEPQGSNGGGGDEHEDCFSPQSGQRELFFNRSITVSSVAAEKATPVSQIDSSGSSLSPGCNTVRELGEIISFARKAHEISSVSDFPCGSGCREGRTSHTNGPPAREVQRPHLHDSAPTSRRADPVDQPSGFGGDESPPAEDPNASHQAAVSVCPKKAPVQPPGTRTAQLHEMVQMMKIGLQAVQLSSAQWRAGLSSDFRFEVKEDRRSQSAEKRRRESHGEDREKGHIDGPCMESDEKSPLKGNHDVERKAKSRCAREADQGKPADKPTPPKPDPIAFGLPSRTSGCSILSLTTMTSLTMAAAAGGYEGEMKEGRPHGWGVYSNRQGDRYEGQWRDGTVHGRGTYRSAEGDIYTGELQGGKRNGEGMQQYWQYAVAYDVYKGQWVEGEWQGTGTYTFVNGDVFEGEWEKSQWKGKGVFRSQDGDEYTGDVRDSTVEGHGTAKYKSGYQYVGEWKAGRWNGRGTLRSCDGVVWDGEWRDGDFVQAYKSEGKGDSPMHVLQRRAASMTWVNFEAENKACILQ